MGWLGLSEDECLDASFTSIERAYRGKQEMLRACFNRGESSGADEPEEPKKAMIPATAENVKNAFRFFMQSGKKAKAE